LQGKIREYTKKLLDRRDAPKGAPKKDRLDAAKDLREVKNNIYSILKVFYFCLNF
jgi:hypothetical protein